jgi:hypothetical protein
MNLARGPVRMAGAALVALTVVGCATEPKIVYTPYETRVPIPAPCVVPVVPEPEWATNQMPRVGKDGDGIDEATRKLLAERQQRLGYEDQLRKAQAGCK